MEVGREIKIGKRRKEGRVGVVAVVERREWAEKEW